MPMTMTQKILAAHAGLPAVQAGQLIEARLDLCLANDITAPVSLDAEGEYAEILVYSNSSRVRLLARLIVRPVLFAF